MQELKLKCEEIIDEITKLGKNGNNYTLYLPKIIVTQILKNPKLVFPTFCQKNNVNGIGYYFEPPTGYNSRPYHIYYLKRGDKVCAYLPVPDLLKNILLGSRKSLLVRYTIGFDSNDKMVLFLQRYFHE